MQLENGYLLWGLTARRGDYPAQADDLGGADLVEAATVLLRRWSSRAHALLAATDPASVSFYGLYSADPDTDLTPWPSGVITALGDAIHPMPPTGGRGAITAIRDADSLIGHLSDAHRLGSPLPLAVNAYETGVAGYAPAAIRESLQPLSWQRALRVPAAYPLLRAVGTLTELARNGRSKTRKPLSSPGF